MSAKKSLDRRAKPAGGHTGQYITLAESLRQAAEALEADLAYLEKKGFSVGLASLRIEARCATVAVLSAALCECVANTILANRLTAAAFGEIEGDSMPEKWRRHIPRTLDCPSPDAATIQMLRTLQKTRNSIVHSQATVFDEREATHIRGNEGQWVNLTPQMAREFVSLPVRLVEIVPATTDGLMGIGLSLRERQPRLPRVHVAEVLTALELLDSPQREVVRATIARLEAAEPA